MLPIKKIYIDTRFKSSDSESHSDFKIDLPITYLMPEDTGFYIDDVCIPHSFYTIETGVNDQLQFMYLDTTRRTVTIPEGNYNITTLASAMSDGMNDVIDATLVDYDVNLKNNTFQILLAPNYTTGQFKILTDSEITTQSIKNRSINTMLKNFVSKGMDNSPFVSGYIDLVPIRNLYLSCSGLGNFNTMTLSGNRNIVKKIPVNAGPGEIIFDQTVTGMDYLDCSGQTLSRISFQLKDAYGKTVDLHGNHFSFSIVFSRVQNGT